MDPLTSAAASGLRSNLQALDMLANNLANVQTNGYKTDREFYDLYTSADAIGGGDYDPIQMPTIEKNWTDFSQGALQQTSNQLDFGISGEGFFKVTGPSGPLYTRNGSFRTNATGQLLTQDNYPVLGANGNPIQLNPNQPVDVDTRGTITQGGQAVGQLQIVSFKKLSDLSKQGQTYFRYGGSDDDNKTASGEIQQGKVETSNVPNAEAAVRLVSVMRQFEMLQKAINIGAEMSKQAIEDVARSGA